MFKGNMCCDNFIMHSYHYSTRTFSPMEQTAAVLKLAMREMPKAAFHNDSQSYTDTVPKLFFVILSTCSSYVKTDRLWGARLN